MYVYLTHVRAHTQARTLTRARVGLYAESGNAEELYTKHGRKEEDKIFLQFSTHGRSDIALARVGFFSFNLHPSSSGAPTALVTPRTPHT